ncbi:MAG TPA: CHAT domain-containing protein, partial [Candidatus Xenobia bacterium]
RLPETVPEVQSEVTDFRSLVSNPTSTGWQKPARHLYGVLISPLSNRLDRYHRLVIVPSGALNALPFAALVGPDGKPLAIRHALVALPSATVLQFCRARNPGPVSKPVLFAIGHASAGKYPPLPGTLQEVADIHSLYPGAEVEANDQFTKDHVVQQAPLFDVVHFATHGILDRRHPQDSAIICADGPFDIQHLVDLRLHAGLVVLSACETGLGRLYRGDEMVGLTRSMMLAGTPSVLATLWSVADHSTAQFMSDFYRSLKAGHDKAAALQSAQVSLMKQYPHPFYWAPFQLQGDWR